ncbi:MAG: DUF2914 domain-containing protein [Nitrospirae bacterium]|nr:DUF2914 domain-containing protein [Nitrospirota bacterium]
MIRPCSTKILRGLWLMLALIPVFWSRPAAPQEKAAPPITIEEAVIATGVTNLTPVGSAESFSSDVGKLYCFTRIKSDVQPASIKHLWFHGDKMVMEITLPIKSAHWRTYSTKTILPSGGGAWKVDITTEDGTILKTLNFTIR